MANWFVPFRQLQRREALVGQRVNERTNQSRPHSLTCANLTYVNIQFTQPTSTSHLLNLASCFVSLPLSVSLFFFGCPRTFPTCLPPQLSICFSSCGCLAMEILCVLFLPGTVRIIFSSALCAWCQDAGFTVFSTVWFCSCFRRLQDILFFLYILPDG